MPYNIQKPYQFGLMPKEFVSFGKKCRKKPENLIDFKTGLDQILELEASWKMIDTIQSLDKVHVNFCGEEPTFQFRTSNRTGSVCRITRHALKQLATYIKPKMISGTQATAYNITEATCILDEDYRKLATMMWSKLLDGREKEVLFRSKLIDGERVITSVQSTSYAPIKDSRLLQELHKRKPELVFCGANVNSISSNYRLVENKELELDKPVDMYDIYNSDGGLRGLQLFHKYWLLVCTNGMTTTRTKDNFYTRHFGDSEILTARFGAKLDELDGDREFLDAYQKARSIGIENMFQTMTHRMNLNKDEENNVSVALGSNLIASPQNTLGACLDAITLSAQAKKDPFERHLIECKGTEFMMDALRDLEQGKELVPAELLEI